MRNHRTRVLGVLSAVLLLVAVPSSAFALEGVHERLRELINRQVVQAEERVADLMDHYCSRFERFQERYGSGVPVFCDSEPAPDPDPIPVPEPPAPEEGALRISEVYYDVDTVSKGGDPANEWVELYNDSDAAMDVRGYMLADAASSDVLPEGASVPANGYLVVGAGDDTPSFWDIPEGAEVVTLNQSIDGGLNNGGDIVTLSDDEGTELDAVSWDENTDAFAPSVPAVADGSSIARTDPTVDNDDADDWDELLEPTPGE